MRREAGIPLFLWAATAALAHVIWGGGADQGARLIEEQLDIGRFAAGIRSHVRGAIAPPLEIAIDDESTPEDESKPDEPSEKPEDDNEQADESEPADVKDEDVEAPKKD